MKNNKIKEDKHKQYDCIICKTKIVLQTIQETLTTSKETQPY